MNQRIPNIPINNKKEIVEPFTNTVSIVSIIIVLIVLFAFPEVLTWRICLTVKSLDFQMVTIPFILCDHHFAGQFRGEKVEADSNFHTMRSPTWTLQCLLLHVPNLNCLQLIHAI